ncbi:hypothetical protein I5677_15535 [Mobilitalea sibirica]|uniref:Uncharacterized protein n=1 Tax=Mobilitalea sibirica TaxID=1462919 RepID=A0A8J7H4F2_9FIRM|nr:hypothetical protein [Mobilitalea sibirica]MBH1942313.1 hypothetical protein [Mobilitalea sibirica]
MSRNIQEVIRDEMRGETGGDYTNNWNDIHRSFNMSDKLRLVVMAVLLLLMAFVIKSDLDYINTYRNISAYTLISKNAIEIYHDASYNKTYVFDTKGNMLHQIDTSTRRIEYTPDYTAAIITNNDNRRFYYVSDKEYFLVNENGTYPHISDNGRFLYYTNFDDAGKLVLYQYDVDDKKEIRIDSEQSYMFRDICVSPNGKAVAYSKVANTPSESYETFLSIEGNTPQKLGNDISVFGVADGGKYLYYKNEAGSLFVSVQGEVTGLAGGMDWAFFNLDYSEILYTNSKGTYFSVNGKPSKHITDSKIFGLVTPSNYLDNDNHNGSMKYEITSFQKKAVICSDGGMRFITADFKVNDLLPDDDYYHAITSNSGEDVIYMSREGVFKLSNLSGVVKREEFISDLKDYVVAPDFSSVYYIDTNGDLYYRNASGKTKLITKNVANLYLNRLGDTVFFLVRNIDQRSSLYYSRNGGTGYPIDEGDEVRSFDMWNYGIIFTTGEYGERKVYYNTRRSDFSLILTN